MLNPSQQALKGVSLALLLCFGPLTQAADAVTQAMQTATGPYRMVLFKTNGTSHAESQRQCKCQCVAELERVEERVTDQQLVGHCKHERQRNVVIVAFADCHAQHDG